MTERRAHSIFADARALGATLPVRAAYEASKRSGFHAVLFGARWPERTTPPSHEVLLGNLNPYAAEAADRALADAQLVDAEGMLAFGRRTATGRSLPWNVDPETGATWDDGPWWRIDIRTPDRLGDVKQVWEVARHRDLVVLARAARLDPSGSWAALLDDLLQQWCAQNPPERGINWYSSLELSLRAIAWCQVYALAGDALGESTRAAMDRQLRASGRHLMTELPYTMSSMKNNHLLGDALGLIVLSRLFPNGRSGRRWAKFGERLFLSQLRRHMRLDGSMIEDSLSYHRFVLEMLCVRVLLGEAPPEVYHALAGATDHLCAIGVLDGPVPQYGDWDEGRVLATSTGHLSVAGSAALGLALTGRAVPAEWSATYDELAWYAPIPKPDAQPSPPRAPVSGGLVHIVRGPWRVWFKVGSGPSHGHADLTSVWVQRDRQWLIADPGTGTYNGPLEVRNAFRTSRAHPVVRVDDVDQLEPHRAFRWIHTAQGKVAPPVRVDDLDIAFGWHNAYSRLTPTVLVARAVVVADRHVTVVEFVADPASRPTQMTLPLAPGVRLSDDRLTGGGADTAVFGCTLNPLEGDGAAMSGWFSPTYGSWETTTWLMGPAARVWGLGDAPEHSVTAHHVQVGSVRLTADLGANGASLEVTAADGSVAVIRP